jgi:hypothetical protein
MFRRYNITTPAETRTAMENAEKFLHDQATSEERELSKAISTETPVGVRE